MSATVVVKLAREAGERLYRELGRGSYAFRPVDHAHWAAQGVDVSVVWYRSGKLVVQGKGAAAFLETHRAILGENLGGVAPGSPALASARVAADRPVAGSDESGKGDYFGPLTVAAALVRPGQEDVLRRLDIVDSKLAGDERIRRAEGPLMKTLVTAVRVLEPEAYNAAWAKVGNVNVLLGRLHAEVLNEVLAKEKNTAGCRIVVDRFGEPAHVTKHLSVGAKRAVFAMFPRAESEPAVAAASFLARAAFLRGMDTLRADAPVELPFGASDPRILDAARALVHEGGREWLGKFAKLHFKTTRKALGEPEPAGEGRGSGDAADPDAPDDPWE